MLPVLATLRRGSAGLTRPIADPIAAQSPTMARGCPSAARAGRARAGQDPTFLAEPAWNPSWGLMGLAFAVRRARGSRAVIAALRFAGLTSGFCSGSRPPPGDPVPPGRFHRLVPRAGPTSWSLGLVPRAGPTGRSHGPVPRAGPTGRSHGLVPRADPTGRSHGPIPRADPTARRAIRVPLKRWPSDRVALRLRGGGELSQGALSSCLTRNGLSLIPLAATVHASFACPHTG